jgi:predicted PurR-regulated permease PerM
MIALFDAITIGLGIALLGVPLVKPIVVLTFLLAYIPLVGALLSGAVAVLVALGAEGFPTALGVLAIVVVVQQLEGNVLGPLLTARAVHFHPVATFLMMTVAGALFGISGMVLTVPAAGACVAMTAVLRSTTGQSEPDSGEPDRRQRSRTERLPA